MSRMKTVYCTPEMEVIAFANEDVITTSNINQMPSNRDLNETPIKSSF